ncbi:MAG TPA: DUF883 family protein [Patescibacteria group bacterium]|jgi:ElaB/YqjD/DUF883 family membrane-anchored ribosome-binding protein|nr:DUF883 family protein [Patescibacteria group bacterium]
MEKHEEENNLSTLVRDARALVAATADVAGDKVVEARKRLAAALDTSREMLGRASQRAVEQAKAADRVIRDNPYQIAVTALGVGALIGYLAARKCRREA